MNSSQELQRLQELQAWSRRKNFVLPIDLQKEYNQLLKNRRNLVLEWTGMGHRVQL